MFSTTFLILMAFAGIFIVLAALTRDKISLVPAGGMLILIASMVFLTGSFQVKKGEVTYTNESVEKLPGGNYTNATSATEYAYAPLDSFYDVGNISEYIGLIILASGIFCIWRGYLGDSL